MFKVFSAYDGNTVTINTNKNCLLKCSYCYENKPTSITEDKLFWSNTKYKNRLYDKKTISDVEKCKTVIDVEKCKTFIDLVLSADYSNIGNIFKRDRIIFDFIGGDALQYPELLEEIFNYILEKIYYTKFKFRWKFQISSNGVVFLNKKVRDFCEKWKDNLSIGISIDGCEELHDLNRKTVSKNIDSYDGSFKYILEIFDWYRKTFPNSSDGTKWTLVPNSYKYLFKSIKYLYEKMKIQYIHFNRAMEQNVQDTEEDILVLINEFEQINEYLLKNHIGLYLSPYEFYRISTSVNLKTITERDPEWSRCGFGQMPALDLDGSVYPCFRMIPENSKANSYNCKQGDLKDIFSNKDNLKKLYTSSLAANLLLEEKCKTCILYTTCPHCAADCVSNKGEVIKNTSICNYHIIETLFVIKYWIKASKIKIYNKKNVFDYFSIEEIEKLSENIYNNFNIKL